LYLKILLNEYILYNNIYYLRYTGVPE